mmetsp:Transcript_32008/g.39302  ORF Transcript_32008/g.39302 Transcript_32008/m.39302 type:complete len:598 (-) Transcript_32008:25-1818(-)
MLEQLSQGIRWLSEETSRRQMPEDDVKEYSFKDLHVGTGGFSQSNRLGRDAGGSVYRGLLQGAAVAIKAVTDDVNLREEVRLLGRLRHPNLACLLGWSMHQHQNFLVYELLSGGDLHSHLDKHRMEVKFTAIHRRLAAFDTSKGLSYMMTLTPKAFHRDIKPLNIVLEKGTAKLVDFGVQDVDAARLKVDRISGTPGYACPIYLQTGKVTEQSEVFSFGTVLLELLVNVAPALTDGKGGLIYPLLQMIQPAAPGALQRLLEHAEFSAGWKLPELEDVAKLALRCVDFTPARRPLFKEIADALRPVRQDSLRTPRYAAETEGNRSRALKELILSCVWTPKFCAPSAHNIAIKVEPKEQWEVPIGRNHQPDFFEKIMDQESLSKISRTHFKIGVSQNQLIVCKYSSNPFLVNGTPLEQGSTVAIRNNDMLTLSDPPIVVLRVQLRFQEAPGRTPRTPREPRGATAATAVLECVKSICTDVKGLPKEAKRIALDTGHVVSVGRKHQELIFDKLLKANWLYNISRTHLKVCFHATELFLQVQNLSTNPVMVNGRQLKQSQTGKILPGGCIAFLARTDGKEQTTFLEFNLHMDAKRNLPFES